MFMLLSLFINLIEKIIVRIKDLCRFLYISKHNNWLIKTKGKIDILYSYDLIIKNKLFKISLSFSFPFVLFLCNDVHRKGTYNLLH